MATKSTKSMAINLRAISVCPLQNFAEQGRPGDTEENERIWTRSRLGAQMHPEWVAGAVSEGSRPGKIVKTASVQLKAWRCREEAGNRRGSENGGTIENALMARCEISN